MNINELSLEEKIGQMFMFGVNSKNIDCLYELIKNNKIGGVILYRNNYSTYEEMLDVVKKLKDANKDNKIPLFISIDQEGGRVNRMPKELKNIKNIFDLGSLKDIKIIKKSASITGKMLYESGVNMNFAPVLDIYNNSNSRVLERRCFSSDVDIASEYGTVYMNELNKNKVISVVKHFPGHGASSRDSHVFVPYISNSEEILNKHILPFEYAINNGCDAIMVGHMVIKGMTSGLPASISSKFISKYLREKYNYNGLIITDDIRMMAVSIFYRFVSLKNAFKSGSDIILFKYRNNDVNVINKVINMVKNNVIDIESINKSVERILNIKSKYNVNDGVNYAGCNVDKINLEIESINNIYNRSVNSEG